LKKKKRGTSRDPEDGGLGSPGEEMPGKKKKRKKKINRKGDLGPFLGPGPKVDGHYRTKGQRKAALSKGSFKMRPPGGFPRRVDGK